MEWLKRDALAYSSGGKVHGKSLPFKNGSPTKQFNIVCLFLGGKTVKTRKDILKEVGSPTNNGYNASLFQTLIKNEIIAYCGEYKAGRRFKEYIRYCAEELVRLGMHKRYRKLYVNLLKESSQAMHFILSD